MQSQFLVKYSAEGKEEKEELEDGKKIHNLKKKSKSKSRKSAKW